MTNLVIGFVTNTPESAVRIFVQSMRRVYSTDECDVVLIANRFEPYFRELSDLGVKFLPTSNNSKCDHLIGSSKPFSII
jgi:hypothetical protein